MSRKHKPDHISALLGEMITRRKWQDRFELHEVFDFWEKSVGKEIAKHATPSKFRGKVLWVDVSDSIWMQQLQFLKTTLMDKINQEFDSVQVEDIRFQLRLPSDKPQKEAPTLRHIGPQPEAGDLTKFEEFLGDVDDPELKVAMLRCWRILFPYKDE